MNERIAKLAAKSGFDVGIHDGLILGNFSDMYKLEKFAELIVRECIRIPYDMWDKAELNADIALKIEHRIRDHFWMFEE